MKLSAAVLLTLAALASHAVAYRPPCAGTCHVSSHWKPAHTCPWYCKTVTCYKNYFQGVRCVEAPAPTPSASPAPKLPHGCAKVCVATPWKFGYRCPYYCDEVSCHKHHQKGIKCVPTPPPAPSASPSPTPLPHGCAKVCVATPWKFGYKCPYYCSTVTCHKHYQKGIKCVPTPEPTPSASPAPKLPHGCAKVCVATPWKYSYACPYYCNTVTCHKHYQKGIKCVPTPEPTPSASPAPKLPHGCAKICVATPWKYKYSCPYYCDEKPCHKHYQKGIKCVPTPMPTPSASPAPKLPHGCAKVCVATPWKFGYSCPHYCDEKPCHKHHQSGIKCVPTPTPAPKLPEGCAKVCVATPWKHGYECPDHCETQTCHKHYQKGIKCVPRPHRVHSPCPAKCMPWSDLQAAGCDEDLCSVDLCSSGHYGARYAKCVPRY